MMSFHALVAPGLLLVEAADALWKRYRRRELDAYDGLYLALAAGHGRQLVTADRRLYPELSCY